MKQVIFNLYETNDYYTFEMYLVKVKESKYRIINKYPFSIRKNKMNSIKDIKNIYSLITSTINASRFTNASYKLSINPSLVIRDTFFIPEARKTKTYNILEYEIKKRFRNDYLIFTKNISNNRYDVLLISSEFNSFFNMIKPKIKNISFMDENILYYLKRYTNEENYILLILLDNLFMIIVCVDGILEYTYSSENCDINDIFLRLESIYGFYSKSIKSKIYFVNNAKDDMLLNDIKDSSKIKNLNYLLIDIPYKGILELDSLFCTINKKGNHYERIK